MVLSCNSPVRRHRNRHRAADAARLPTAAWAWHKVAGQSSDGYRLLCRDLRGFGWSEITRRAYDMDGLADPCPIVGGAHLGPLCLYAPERFTGTW
ncbi:alpha/beta fold hydrolase [Streptomyces sp. NK08204]|uniref:alpha/beta fold hydrolase n=1 Tax=Streptomyces sp. NK08204 TaxID=2873260 RepID=UPI001CEDA24D|nr:alpha/beta hydrolase [Streptomyces sp. NK08204]